MLSLMWHDFENYLTEAQLDHLEKSVLSPKKCAAKSHELVIWSVFYWSTLALMFILFKPREISYCLCERCTCCAAKHYVVQSRKHGTGNDLFRSWSIFVFVILDDVQTFLLQCSFVLIAAEQDGVIAVWAPCRSARFQAGGRLGAEGRRGLGC